MDIITRYFIAMAFMLMFLFIWMLVQKLSRKVAKTHPEFGPAREEGAGCAGGGKCNCNSLKKCTNSNINHKVTDKKIRGKNL